MTDILNTIQMSGIWINILNGLYYYSSFYVCFIVSYLILLDIGSTDNNSLNKLTASSNYTRPYILMIPISIIFLVLIFKYLIMFRVFNTDYTQEYNNYQVILIMSMFFFSLLSYKLSTYILEANLTRIINNKKQ